MKIHRLAHALFTIHAGLCTAALARAHDGDPKGIDPEPSYQGPGWRNIQRLPNGGGASQALTGPPTFASFNMTLASWMPLPEFGLGTESRGSNCFGYVSPSGREYAIFNHQSGTAFVEVTQPGNPQIVAQIAGPLSEWRDARVFQNFCYVVSEGGSGIRVIDLAQIDAGVVSLHSVVNDDAQSATHTLEINTQTGYLYRCGGASLGGTAQGLRIYDLNITPGSPQRVSTWPDRYVHECQSVNFPTGGPGGGPRELVICSAGLNGGHVDTGIDILDVTDHTAPVSLAHITYPNSGYSHQAWLSPDLQWLYHNDELDNRPYTRVFDASGLNNAVPQLTYAGEFQSGTSIDHNLYTKGNLIFEANYTDGLRIFDRSTSSTAPQLTAWFDTYPGSDAPILHSGLWGSYPYFPSGIIIASDRQRGLFVLWLGPPPLELALVQTPPAFLSPSGQLLPVSLVENLPGALAAGSAKLHYDTGSGWSSVDLIPTGIPGSYVAPIPPVACGRRIDYYLSARSTTGMVWTDPTNAPGEVHTSLVGSGVSPQYTDPFESDFSWQSGLPGDTASSGVWVRGSPPTEPAQPLSDHTPPPGISCWHTGAGDVDGGTTSLLSPLLDMSSMAEPAVSYWRWYSNSGGPNPAADTFRFDVSNDDGVTWVNMETAGPNGPQTSGGWYQSGFRVSEFVQPTAQMRVRFVAEDANADSRVEAAVDDFILSELACAGSTPFCAGDGTGSPCPCGNTAASGAGCANSTGTGATLSASGMPSVSADSLVLSANGLPPVVSVLHFQGTSAQAGGLGSPFGDGLRCAGGSVLRLGTTVSSGGQTSYPGPGDQPVSVRGAVTSPATRYYQSWYRNAASFCTPSTFNLSSGLSVVWGQ